MSDDDLIGHNGGPSLNRGKAGWVAISRAIREHWLVGFGQPVKPCDPSRGSLSRTEAFIDLIMECRYEAGSVMNGGRKMLLQPGQLLGAVSYLAHRWNWSPQTVRTWLDKLENDGMIERAKPGVLPENNKQAGKQSSVITVCNFGLYQVTDEPQKHAKQQAINTQATSNQQASNNNNKDNKGTLPPIKTREEPVPVQAAVTRNVPHMNGKGFIISAEHDLFIPNATVDQWRQRYPDVPDLEALMQSLAAIILKNGPMHTGWRCPEGWMPKILADENQKAADRKAEHVARRQRAAASYRDNQSADGKKKFMEGLIRK